MKQMIITIDTTNEAFGSDTIDATIELSRIFDKLSNDLNAGEQPTDLLDSNNNVVGLVSYEFAENTDKDALSDTELVKMLNNNNINYGVF